MQKQNVKCRGGVQSRQEERRRTKHARWPTATCGFNCLRAFLRAKVLRKWFVGLAGLWGSGCRSKNLKKAMQICSKIDAEIFPKSSQIHKNQSKVDQHRPTSVKNPSKIYKNAIWGGFGGSRGAGSAPPRLKRYPLGGLLGENGNQSADFGSHVGSKIIQNRCKNRCR